MDGIIYPTIELAGVTYTVKFSQAVIAYRLSRLGTKIQDLWRPEKSLAAVVDILHAAIQDQLMPGVFPTPESLVEYLAAEKKIGDASIAVRTAVGKVFPPVAPPAPAEQPTAVQ